MLLYVWGFAGAERLAFCYRLSEMTLLPYFFCLVFIPFPNEVHRLFMKRKISAGRHFHLLEYAVLAAVVRVV